MAHTRKNNANIYFVPIKIKTIERQKEKAKQIKQKMMKKNEKSKTSINIAKFMSYLCVCGWKAKGGRGRRVFNIEAGKWQCLGLQLLDQVSNHSNAQKTMTLSNNNKFKFCAREKESEMKERKSSSERI